jgi:hypothetical protein
LVVLRDGFCEVDGPVAGTAFRRALSNFGRVE